MMFKPCLIIPVYNNRDTIGPLLDRLEPYGVPCFLVDDGSAQDTRAELCRQAETRTWVQLRRLPKNGGKGAAVRTGLLWSAECGFSHALQIDADGQHETADIGTFLEVAKAHPRALVLGTPVFGGDVPRARLYGRKLSRLLVRLETISSAIADPLFGFRVYPLHATAALLGRARIGLRMDFDPEIAVRLYWAGTPIRNLKTRVHYPEEGVSHFRMVRDNIKIGWMHARLLAGMLLHLPGLLGRKAHE